LSIRISICLGQGLTIYCGGTVLFFVLVFPISLTVVILTVIIQEQCYWSTCLNEILAFIAELIFLNTTHLMQHISSERQSYICGNFATFVIKRLSLLFLLKEIDFQSWNR